MLPRAKFNKDNIELEGNEIKILFSTEDKKKVGFILFSAFIGQKNKAYPLKNNNFMVLKNIKNEKEEEILNSKAIFKTTIGSGICVRDHDRESNKDIYYVYSDKEFREKLQVILNNELIKAGFTKEEANEIKVNPIQCKKVVVFISSSFLIVNLVLLNLTFQILLIFLIQFLHYKNAAKFYYLLVFQAFLL